VGFNDRFSAVKKAMRSSSLRISCADKVTKILSAELSGNGMVEVLTDRVPGKGGQTFRARWMDNSVCFAGSKKSRTINSEPGNFLFNTALVSSKPAWILMMQAPVAHSPDQFIRYKPDRS
jgi:hypothetical protein